MIGHFPCDEALRTQLSTWLPHLQIHLSQHTQLDLYLFSHFDTQHWSLVLPEGAHWIQVSAKEKQKLAQLIPLVQAYQGASVFWLGDAEQGEQLIQTSEQTNIQQLVLGQPNLQWESAYAQQLDIRPFLIDAGILSSLVMIRSHKF